MRTMGRISSSCSRYSHWAAAIATILALSVPAARAQEDDMCTICADGSVDPPNPAGDMGSGLTCGTLAPILAQNTAATNPDCQQIQIRAHVNCGCPDFPQVDANANAFCPMCPDAAIDIEFPLRRIPIFDDATCEDSLFQLQTAESSPTLCADIQRVGHYCGCPNAAPPVCQFCADGSSPPLDKILPPTFAMTCREFGTIVSFSADETECNGLIESMLPLDPVAYCGCNATLGPPDPAVCTLCPADGTLVDNPSQVTADLSTGVTCQQVLDMAPFIDDVDYCTNAFQGRFAVCCGGTPSAPDNPTMAPPPAATPTTNSGSNTSHAVRYDSSRSLLLGTMILLGLGNVWLLL